MREEVSKGIIKAIKWIPTEEMLADGLTKKGACCRDLCSTLETGIIKDIKDIFMWTKDIFKWKY